MVDEWSCKQARRGGLGTGRRGGVWQRAMRARFCVTKSLRGRYLRRRSPIFARSLGDVDLQDVVAILLKVRRSGSGCTGRSSGADLRTRAPGKANRAERTVGVARQEEPRTGAPSPPRGGENRLECSEKPWPGSGFKERKKPGHENPQSHGRGGAVQSARFSPTPPAYTQCNTMCYTT